MPRGHHLDQITGTEFEGEIPSYAENDDFLVKVPASRGPLSMRRRRTSGTKDSGVFYPTSVVRKRHANSRRKSASIWKSLSLQSPILNPLCSSQEFDGASASFSIPAPWKRPRLKKGARHREKSTDQTRRSTRWLDAPLRTIAAGDYVPGRPERHRLPRLESAPGLGVG